MEELLGAIEALKQSEVKGLIDARIREFREIGEASSTEVFKELCFCILTANFSAERGIKIQKEIGAGFLTLPESKLTEKLKELGHRYPEARAKYIVETRRYSESLKEIIESFCSGRMLREWLAENVKGLGFKEASHFLRNIGYEGLAILDRHILRTLVEAGVICELPKALSRKTYLDIEQKVLAYARRLGIPPDALDMVMWSAKTGHVFK